MSVMGIVTLPRNAMLSRITGKEKPPVLGGRMVPCGHSRAPPAPVGSWVYSAPLVPMQVLAPKLSRGGVISDRRV